MKRRDLLGLLASAAAPSPTPPNIVLILADDLGWSDLGCYGSRLHETPNIDAFVRTSLRFTHAYSASPVCSPTRASILTGKHPARLGITIWHEGSLSTPRNRRLLQASSEPNLPLAETTLAEHLRTSGYGTALVGKWHLGVASHYPEAQGFDFNIGGTFWGAPSTYFAPYRGAFNQETRYVPGLAPAPKGEYLTDRLTSESIQVIDHFSSHRQPFFLNLSHHTPHTPIEPRPDLLAKYEAKLRNPRFQNLNPAHTNPGYAAMVESFDQSVGRVLTHLRQRKLDQNTVVIVTSDNGGFLDGAGGKRITTNWPLRSGKGSLYEGGIRVPLMIRWPGQTTPGVCAEPVTSTDLFHTLHPASQPGDGLNLQPLFKDPQSRLPREQLFFHYPHYYPTTTPVSAIRTRQYKLLEYFEDNRLELYDLTADPGESTNLAPSRPDLARDLRDQLHAWRNQVGARLPSPNPDFKN